MSKEKKLPQGWPDDFFIASSFNAEMNGEKVLIGPGEEQSFFPVLTGRPTHLLRLIEAGRIQRRQHEVPLAGKFLAASLDWGEDDFRIEFGPNKTRGQIIAAIRQGRNGKFLSASSLRRLRFWIEGQSYAGSIGAKAIVQAISHQLRQMGEPEEAPFADLDPNAEDYFEKQLERLELEKMEEEINKPETETEPKKEAAIKS